MELVQESRVGASRLIDSVSNASLALRLQNVELTQFGWNHNICGEAHRASGIKRVGQDRRPLRQRQREVSACEQCESAVGRPILSRNSQGSTADYDAGNRGLRDDGRANVANLKEVDLWIRVRPGGKGCQDESLRAGAVGDKSPDDVLSRAASVGAETHRR